MLVICAPLFPWEIFADRAVQMVLTGAWYVTYHGQTMETFRDVIAAWPNLDAIKADTGAEVGAIKQWRNRDNIPGEYWLALEVGAAKRSIPGITMHILGRIALAKRPPATDPEKPAEAAA